MAHETRWVNEVEQIVVDLDTNEVAGKIKKGWGNRLWFYQRPTESNWKRVDRKKKAILALTGGRSHAGRP